MNAFRSAFWAALILAVGTSAAQAQTPSHDEEIRALREQIRQLDQKLRVLERKQELREEETAAAIKALPRITTSDGRIEIASADGANSLRLRGLVQGDFRSYDSANDPNDTFLLRRARLIFDGKFAKNFSYVVQPEFAGGFDGEGRKAVEEIGSAETAMPAGVDDDASAGGEAVLVGAKIVDGDFAVGGLGNREPDGGAVEPIERHAIERAAVVEKVIHRVEMRALVGADQDVGGVELMRGDARVRDDRELGIVGKRRRAMHERMREVDQTRGRGGIWYRGGQVHHGSRAAAPRL